MGARTTAREAALQMLFAIEASQNSVELAIHEYWREMPPEEVEGREYAEELVRGVTQDLSDIDQQIRQASHNWRLERMTRVDRNLLRIGVWELMRHPEVPRAVVLDEAVEIAKRFGTEESSAFINGVLDRVADNLGRPNEPRTLPNLED